MTEDEALNIGADFQKYLDDASNESLINKYSLIQLKQAKKLLHKKHIGKAWYDELLKRIGQLEKLQDEKRLNKWWNKPLFVCVVSVFLTGIVSWFIAINIFNKHKTDSKVQIDLAKKQLDELQKMKNENKQNAVDSLAIELEQNKAWVYQFIHDCEEGNHLGKNGYRYSWPWNLPKLNAYEKYLTIACSGDKELSTKIMNLYSRLESCGVIVNSIHELLNNSSEVNNSEITEKIIGNNKKVENFCLEIKDYFDEPIKKLESIAQHYDSSKELLKNKEDLESIHLELIQSGTGVSEAIFIEGKKDKIMKIKPLSNSSK